MVFIPFLLSVPISLPQSSNHGWDLEHLNFRGAAESTGRMEQKKFNSSGLEKSSTAAEMKVAVEYFW